METHQKTCSTSVQMCIMTQYCENRPNYEGVQWDLIAHQTIKLVQVNHKTYIYLIKTNL